MQQDCIITAQPTTQAVSAQKSHILTLDVRGAGLIQSPGVVKSVEKKKSVAGQFAVKYKSETYCWTQILREDYGVDKSTGYWLL